ncbi:alpha/beta hydrolase [Arthrobacter sp. I2-34]|uniref:Alpha/beta hydrolase n=1 Tax=Arthrobacter hankyongi TaxID=2904801 RepID=A0ABS9L4E6_9MICC|nr:alpha/beta hydrolase [Arthrobacter hankyongi]MCG2621367.1 alpha/beta hydrolase [Arthrobacter hankyongi]
MAQVLPGGQAFTGSPEPARIAPAAAAGAVAATLAASTVLWFLNSPRPATWLIRRLGSAGTRRLAQAMARHVPDGVSEVLDLQYLADHQLTYLDVFFPSGVQHQAQRLPTIVWVHGGAWIAGSKSDVANYLRVLASSGFTVVGVGYSLAHEYRYPEPVRQTAAALQYLQENAERLHVDPDRFVLAGDSAGAQIASQLALVVSDPAYAERLGIAAPIARDRLRAALLYCGAYDLSLINAAGAARRRYEHSVLWSYTGFRNYSELPYIGLASVSRHVGRDFPPSFVAAGNADPMLAHSVGFADVLAAAGVETDTFFPRSERGLPHEFQFHLEEEAAWTALTRSIEFLRRHTD